MLSLNGSPDNGRIIWGPELLFWSSRGTFNMGETRLNNTDKCSTLSIILSLWKVSLNYHWKPDGLMVWLRLYTTVLMMMKPCSYFSCPTSTEKGWVSPNYWPPVHGCLLNHRHWTTSHSTPPLLGNFSFYISHYWYQMLRKCWDISGFTNETCWITSCKLLTTLLGVLIVQSYWMSSWCWN